jgi:hypothetical protein
MSRLKHLKVLKPPQSKQSKLMAQIAAVARRKGLPCTVTLEEVKRMSLKGGGAKKDWAATAEAKRTKRFRCKNSFISTDGREFLASGDWTRRVKEMYQRDDGVCQFRLPVTPKGEILICGLFAHHPHHIKHKGEGGDDSLGNLVSLCWKHHEQMHPEKQVRLRSIPNVHPNEA